MTQGGTVPAHWNAKFGDVVSVRDTEVFETGPASLRVSVTGGKSGQAFQTISGGAGATISLAGWFKTAGNVKAQVMVQAFADGDKLNQFFQVLYRQGDGDWAEFQKQITLPPWTAFFNIGILAEGDGKAWLDEVHEASSPVDVGAIKPAAPGRSAAIVTPPCGWRPMALVTPDMLAAGVHPGGEGCQYPQTIATDGQNGSFLLFGTDVGGIFRSVDSGKTFVPCMMGYYAVGACGFAIDPKDIDHCLAVGDNRVYAAADDNNLYECDGPAYAPVDIHDRLPKDQHGDGMMVSTAAVDPAKPSIVYTGANGTGLFIERDNAVARSVDGGRTWERLTCNPKYGVITGGQMASAIRVSPKTRELFVGTDCYGLWRIAPP